MRRRVVAAITILLAACGQQPAPSSNPTAPTPVAPTAPAPPPVLKPTTEGHFTPAITAADFAGFVQKLASDEFEGRKPGSLELEIHEDAIERGQKILIVDDVLATGGTASAAAKMVRHLGGELHGLAFLIELLGLNGKARLAGEQVFSVLQY